MIVQQLDQHAQTIERERIKGGPVIKVTCKIIRIFSIDLKTVKS